jgi:hypothetical protein
VVCDQHGGAASQVRRRAAERLIMTAEELTQFLPELRRLTAGPASSVPPRDGRISRVSAHPPEVPIRTRRHYSGASQRCVKPSGRPGTPAGNLSPKPSAPNREEGRSYQPNKEKMTLIRLRAPQLGQMTLNEVGIERCAERPIELTKSLARAAPCTTLGACRSSRAMFLGGGHVWIAPHLHGRLSTSHRTSSSTSGKGSRRG